MYYKLLRFEENISLLNNLFQFYYINVQHFQIKLNNSLIYCNRNICILSFTVSIILFNVICITFTNIFVQQITVEIMLKLIIKNYTGFIYYSIYVVNV